MTLIVLFAITAIFIGTIVAFRISWTLALALLFLVPFLATNIVLICGLAREFASGEFSNFTLRDMLSFALTFYLFTFPYSLYPGGLCLALIGILSRIRLRRSLEAGSLKYTRHLAMAAACGGIIGVVFALFTFLIDGGHSYSFALPITLLTGTIDGLVIALFGQQGRGPTKIANAQVEQLSPA